MPDSWLNIRFDSHYGDRRTSEQISIIPFRDGAESGISLSWGICEDDRRVTRCDMVRIMGWDQMIGYLGEVWDEVWDAMLFKLKTAETSVP
jgi:hypothetical protein